MSHDVILTLLELLCTIIIFVNNQLKFEIFIFFFLAENLNHFHISVLESFGMSDKRRYGWTIFLY